MRAVVFLVAALLLAGCSAAKDTTDDQPSGPAGTSARGGEPLSGFVFDPTIQPIAGAQISIPSIGVETTTDAEGRYAFVGLPFDTVMTVIGQADGYKPSSKSLQLIEGTAMHMNFTLEKMSVKKPYFEVMSFNGVINCNGVVKASGDELGVPCGGAVQGVDNRVWEIQLKPDTAGLVVELAWNADTELARHLNLTIETVGYGDLDKVIFSAEGGSILRGQVGAFDARRFYADGGTVRITVDIGRNTADEEVDAGVGFAVQQGFEIIASAFHVEPPPPDYTAAG